MTPNPQQIEEADTLKLNLQPYGLSVYPGECAMVPCHRSNKDRQLYYKLEDVESLLPQLIAHRDEAEQLRQRLTLQVSIAKDTIAAADTLRTERDELKATVALLTKEGLTLEKEREVLRTREAALMAVAREAKQRVDLTQHLELHIALSNLAKASVDLNHK